MIITKATQLLDALGHLPYCWPIALCYLKSHSLYKRASTTILTLFPSYSRTDACEASFSACMASYTA